MGERSMFLDRRKPAYIASDDPPVVTAAAPEAQGNKRKYALRDNSSATPYPRLKELRQFPGMINFYRRLIPNAADVQSPLCEALQGGVKGSDAIEWTVILDRAFNECKGALVSAAFVAQPDVRLPLALFCDASDNAVGGALNQREGDEWTPLGFFTRKLKPLQRKCSSYDREILAVYEAVKYFRHMLEGREFTIITDHNPIVFAFQQKPEKCSPRQFRYLNYVAQFSTEIRHIAGRDTVVADALSRVEALSSGIDFDALARSQAQFFAKCDDSDNSFSLKKVRVSGCDSAFSVTFRLPEFDSLHQLAHSGIKASTKLVTERFDHVHIDIVGPVPVSNGYRYCVTCADRYSRWVEAIPTSDATADTVARKFFRGWISRFDTPLRVTTDQGRQFESALFHRLSVLTGARHLRTTAYHPAANGMVERFQRQLKATITCHESDSWYDTLPAVLLGIRTGLESRHRRITGEASLRRTSSPSGRVLRSFQNRKRGRVVRREAALALPTDPTRPRIASRREASICPPGLEVSISCLRENGRHTAPLQPPPFRVVRRDAKYFVVEMKGKEMAISIDRLKPSYILATEDGRHDACGTTGPPSASTTTPAAIDPPAKSLSHPGPAPRATRSGRRVHFPRHLEEFAT
ncbi:uncharacterized protein LOC124164968 [Ischnura elegans]|uniref:uncharacterized protein LOC124164968 n=1 Tax=Ischnura elegans TaxID=197161 RepID=UPI001ED87D24|nr:uncharacterized protein LOC124164968 [Ischnura elegans]